MKKLTAMLLAMAMVLSLAACGNGGTTTTAAPGNESQTGTTASTTKADETTPAGTQSPLAGTYDITVWVAEAAVDLTKKQIEDFNASNTDGIVFNATVEAVSESEAATNMIVDVEAGGDIFCFAQDQFARLVLAGALSQLGVQAGATVAADNAEGVVAAAKVGDALYAYPLTADNGYFMYYDKTVVDEAHVASLEDIIADCEAKGKYFAFEMNSSAWYAVSFFFGAGCVSQWETDADGNFTAVNDDFNSAKGLIAAKGMQTLVNSPIHLNSSSGAEFSSGAGVVVTGTWDYETVKGILGDNMGVAELPYYTVDGTQYHLGSFNGCKLLGVKPQTDVVKSAALHKLAQYLTSEAAQLERFNELSWGPANKNAQQNEAVQANPGLAALLAQAPYSQPQGQIPGTWWDIGKVIADDVKAATDEEGLKQALVNYENKINAVLKIDTSGYIFVGAWNGWKNDDDNMRMELVDGVYVITVDVEQSDYMGGRIVTPGDWDTDKGCTIVTDGIELIDANADGNSDNNIIFLEAGNYTVKYNAAANTITITKN